jgi:GntR family transcriptional regulator, rspAB operon transcriptional repressor
VKIQIDTTDDFASTDFRPQEALSIGAQLHRVLRTAIIRAELLPGQLISEIEMSKRFSISRQPVREAFIKLGEERLLEVRPQRGTFIRKISVKEVMDARHLREIIEISIVREVTNNHDASLIRNLRNIITKQQKVKTGDNRSFLGLDEELHRTLALHAGREYAWRVTESIKAQMDRVRFLSYDFAPPKTQLIAEHLEIVDSIETGNPELAARCMEKHLREILSSLPRIAEQYPEYFTED